MENYFEVDNDTLDSSEDISSRDYIYFKPTGKRYKVETVFADESDNHLSVIYIEEGTYLVGINGKFVNNKNKDFVLERGDSK